MHGARDAIASMLAHIEEQVKGIEQAVVENPGLAFDLAKTLIESTCRAVLVERSVSYSVADDLPKLFKSATQNLPFLPATASATAEVRRSLQQTLAGLSTAIQGICELRNQCGFASHGSGGPRPVRKPFRPCSPPKPPTPSSASSTAFIVRTAPRRLRRGQPSTATAPSTTMWTSPSGPSRSLKWGFRPSEVLYRMEPETYRIYLAEFDGDDAEAAAPAEDEAQR